MACKMENKDGFGLFEGDELSGVELNLVTDKGGLFYIILYKTLSGP